MADITLEQAQAQLDSWLTASTNLATSRSVSVDGQSVTLADTIEQIKFWRGEVRRLERQAAGVRSPFFNHGLARFQ